MGVPSVSNVQCYGSFTASALGHKLCDRSHASSKRYVDKLGVKKKANRIGLAIKRSIEEECQNLDLNKESIDPRTLPTRSKSQMVLKFL